MKTKNFPARKLARQQRAKNLYDAFVLDQARTIRTKKKRGGL